MLVAKSMREALLLKPATVRILDLSRSTDVVCVNMMCEKLEGPCVCRVARFLEQNKWDSLEELQLSGNKLDQIAPSIFLRSLRRLDISNNALKEIPADLKNCVNLQVLDASNNNIRKICWDIIGGLPELKTIDLRGNPKPQIPNLDALAGKSILY